MNRIFLLGLSSLFLLVSARAALLEEMLDKTYPIAPNAAISVRNTDGTLFDYGSDVPELREIARKRAFTKERLDGIAIKVNVEGETVSIETTFPPAPKGPSTADRSGTVDYVIMVPERCTVSQVELETGEVIVEGLRGPKVNARLTNGRMIARNCFSDVQLKVTRGSLDIFYDWCDVRFPLQAEIGFGHIVLLLPGAAGVHLAASSGNGDITNGFAKENERRSQTLNTTIGSGEVSEFKLRAGNGNIEIIKVD